MSTDMSRDTVNSFWKDLVVPVVAAVFAAVVTVLLSKACDKISPEDNRVIIADTLRVVETHAQQKDDSLLYNAISELNYTIREVAKSNSSISIVWPESRVPNRRERQETHHESVVTDTYLSNNGSENSKELVEKLEYDNSTNRIVGKKGFYKKGYMISDGGVFYVLEEKPKASDAIMTFVIRLLQPADLLSHIYLNFCGYNEKGELYCYFGQTYEVRDGFNRIKIANPLRVGENRVEIGVFLKDDEGKDFPTFYRNVFTLIK